MTPCAPTWAARPLQWSGRPPPPAPQCWPRKLPELLLLLLLHLRMHHLLKLVVVLLDAPLHEELELLNAGRCASALLQCKAGCVQGWLFLHDLSQMTQRQLGALESEDATGQHGASGGVNLASVATITGLTPRRPKLEKFGPEHLADVDPNSLEICNSRSFRPPGLVEFVPSLNECGPSWPSGPSSTYIGYAG